MGFFSINEHSNLTANVEFPTLEGYVGTVGCSLAIVEGYQNDLALFTAAVTHDITEMHYLKEGYDVEALQEASVSGMWAAIKEFFVKLGAKIKSIFTAFIAKIESYFTKDLKGFVKKYEKNLNGKDFKDMKAKYAAPKNDTYQVANPYPEFKGTADYTKEVSEDAPERADLIEKYYKHGGNASDAKDFDEWYHEQVFNDEEEKDDWDSTTIRAIAARLTANTKLVGDTKKKQDKLLADIKKIISDIEKEQKRIGDRWKEDKKGVGTGLGSYSNNFNPSADDRNTKGTVKDDNKGVRLAKTDLNNATKAVNRLRTEAGVYQEVVLHICQTVMKEIKNGIAQDKRIFTKAVSYKTVKEETLLNAIEECAFDEAMETLDNECAVA